MRPGPPGFVEFHHPRLVDKPPSGPQWLHEVKFDGYRMQVHVKRHKATLYSRRGNDWTGRLPYLELLAEELPDCVLDVELCALDDDGYSSFSALRRGIFNDPDSLVFYAFDILWRGESDLRPYALETRKRSLRAVLDEAGAHISGGVRYVEEVAGGGEGLLKAACRLGWEGIVSKRRDSVYRSGDRSDTWQKSKCRRTESIVVGGYATDNGRFAYLLGGVREKDGRLRYVGSIKGGYGHEVWLDLKPRLKALASDVSPFEIGSPRKTHDIHWLKPDLIAEVEFAEFTGSGKLRQSSFKGLREDLV